MSLPPSWIPALITVTSAQFWSTDKRNVLYEENRPFPRYIRLHVIMTILDVYMSEILIYMLTNRSWSGRQIQRASATEHGGGHFKRR